MTPESVVDTQRATRNRLGLPVDPWLMHLEPGHSQDEIISLIHFEHRKLLGEVEIFELDTKIDNDPVSSDNRTSRETDADGVRRCPACSLEKRRIL
jgi:hypothetical protein